MTDVPNGGQILIAADRHTATANLTRSERRSWAVHRQLATHITATSLTDWAPTVLANIKRLRRGVCGQPHLANLDCWQHIIETNDLPALLRALTGLERHDIETREVTPMGGLLPDDERREALRSAV
ncbi:helix-turn-helix domain-containing protein [Mycobacterium sp. NPDC003449]